MYSSKQSHAYQAAVQRRIAENSRKGSAGWREENADLIDRVRKEMNIQMEKGKSDHFIVKMWNVLQRWGKLSPKQVAATEKVLAKQDEWRAAADAKVAKEAEGKEWVGVEGNRYSFTLTINRIVDLGGVSYSWGAEAQTKYLYAMEDRKGNAYVYIGTSQLGQAGETIKIKATIKSHNTYQGHIKQNRLSRPHVLVAKKDA